MTSKRAKAGDVLEIAAPCGLVYVHYLGSHRQYGHAIAVATTVHEHPAAITPEIFQDSYVTFYPVPSALRQGLARIAGHLPSPGVPTRLRRPGARRGREIVTWIIESEHGEELRQRLSGEELRIPIASIWNHEYLTESVCEGWRPEMEGRDG